MANTFVKIQTVTAGSAVASLAFTSIPQIYTDLYIVASTRSDRAAIAEDIKIEFNGVNTNQTLGQVFGNGATASGSSDTLMYAWTVGNSVTTSIFGNWEAYIPNYATSNVKSVSFNQCGENNAATAYIGFSNGLWSSTAAITSITLKPYTGPNFLQHSSATLYGILKNNAYASGGDFVTTDGTYWYHTYTRAGTTSFAPSKDLTVDYLVVAGGGSSAGPSNNDTSAGGGAGGVRCTVGATGGGGSLETPLSLTANTTYTVTVGAGGTGGAAGSSGTSGSNSVFSTITSTGGGYSAFRAAGVTGGSGSGANGQGTNTAGSGTTNQGYAGGAGTFNGSTGTSGGGGGAGQVGNTAGLGRGGNGVTTSISGTSTTYGGGGGGASTAAAQAGGSGGGGTGGYSTNNSGTDGTPNTGGGAGGAWASAGQGATGKNGGSGIVIIRYLV